MRSAADANSAATSIGLVATGIGIGIVIGWLARGRLVSGTLRRSLRSSADEQLNGLKPSLICDETFSDRPMHPDDEVKLVLVVRNELKMGKGKAAAQCAHAAVMAAELCERKNMKLFNFWRHAGQRKVVVRCETEAEMKQLRKSANDIGLLTVTVHDAGHTQVAAGSRTVLGVGPAPSSVVDAVTGHLKLY